MANPELERVQKQHEELLNRSDDVPTEDIQDFLTLLSQTGSVTEDVDQRALLRSLMRYWSSILYEKTNRLPSIELLPFVGIRTDVRKDNQEVQQQEALHGKRPTQDEPRPRAEMTRRGLLIGLGITGAGLLIGGAIIFNEAGRNNLPTPTPTPTASSGAIFVGDTLDPGYYFGVNTSEGLTNWFTVTGGEICMAYPSGQSWGTVFITVGKPTQPPRPGKDFSMYHQLSLELRGQAGGESVSIGIKDNTQPDTGTETKVPVSGLTTDWKPFVFPLSEFKGANLHKLYVVIEFVFARTKETVCARNIQYLL